MSFTENITKSQEFVDKQHQFKYMRLLSMIYVAFLISNQWGQTALISYFYNSSN